MMKKRQVIAHRVLAAFAGWAKAAARAGAHAHQVTRIQGDAAGHGVAFVRAAVLADHFYVVERAGLTLLQAPRRHDRAGVAAGHEAGVGAHPIVDADPPATPKLTVAAGFVVQCHALDIQAVAGFADLDRAVVGFAMQA